MTPPAPEIESQDAIKTTVDMIRGIMADLHTMGGNDYELPTLNDLIERVETGQVTTKKAQEQAHDIFENKRAYH
jgi:hypothetical protein